MKIEPLVYIITVNWNRKLDTLECLSSLSELDYSNFRILVLDNGSQDGSPQSIKQKFPNIEQINNPRNLGFSAGFNVGIRAALQAGADYIFIINNDTIVDRHCLAILIDHVTPETSLLAPLIFYADQPQQIWSAGGTTNQLTLEKSDQYEGKTDLSQLPDIIERDFLTGCAILIPRQTLVSVGLFDEGYFLYYEDSDLCMRVKQNGQQIFVVPQAKVWHKVASSSGGRYTTNERYWMARSSVRFFRKYVNFWQIPFVLTWRIGSCILSTMRLSSKRNWQALKFYWLGLKDGMLENTR